MEDKISSQINETLRSMGGTPVPFHEHNGYDTPKIDPQKSLLGFRLDFVNDASVAPTDRTLVGTIRFQSDFKSATAHFWLWAYLQYSNATNQQITKWVGTQLS